MTPRKIGLLVLALAALLVGAGWLLHEPGVAKSTNPAASPADSSAMASESQSTRFALPRVKLQAPQVRWWQPGQEHWYGDDPDPFIRQPLDYDENTPRILGNRISYHVYDLETVQDMVRRGDTVDSEIARVKGRALTPEERAAGRRAIQEFFDEAVPVVDGVIGGAMSQDDGFGFIGARRQRLNRDLQAALGLDEDQFYKIWPHIRTVDENRDELTEPESIAGR